jgi:hypothetical protein
MRLWYCPNDLHPAVRAPERLGKDDARRLCLDCTAVSKKNKMVARVCRSAERKAGQRKAQAETKRKNRARTAQATKVRLRRQKEARTTARYTVPGIGDLRFELRRLELLPFAAKVLKDLERGPCPLTVRRRTVGKHCSGTAWHDHRIAITIPEDCTKAQAVGILTHELAHRLCPDDEAHGPAWRNTNLRLIRDGYGIDLTWPQVNDRPASINVAYNAIEAKLALAFDKETL